MSVAPPAEATGLLRGRGPGFGPHMLRLPVRERTLLRVLRDQATARGDAPWLVFDGTERLTFDDAWRGACRVGHALDAELDGPAHVGLLLRNQVEFMPAFYGPQVRGGVTVPLNADSRGPLLQAVIEHSDVELLVVRADLLDRLEELEGLGAVRTVVVVGDGPAPASLHRARVRRWAEWLEGRPDTHTWEFPPHDRPCLIQYTSGTTKRQKGALYTHHYLYLAAAGCTDSQQRTPADVLTTPMPLFHVAALHIVANSALHAGCVAHLKSKFSASRFFAQAAEDGATWAIVLGPMMAMIDKRTPDPVPAHRVERIFCPPPPPNASRLEERFGIELVTHGFGMTEIYPMPMVSRERDDLPLDTLGMPPAWTEYGVVDEHDELVAPGAQGEIVFRPLLPHAMMREYYKDPQQSLDAFRNLMFHTGDLGWYDADGLLHYTSRKQERIRVRGENVSAPELEWLVLSHPAVVEAAAFGVPSVLGEEEIKLDFRCREPLAAAELHAWLRRNAPRYMVPRYLQERDRFPKTPSERIEKYKLAAEGVEGPGVFDAEAVA